MIYQTFEDEKASALENDGLSHQEWVSAGVRQWADVYGEERPDCAWVLSPFDTWERNPHYTGDDFRHPEELNDEADYLAWLETLSPEDRAAAEDETERHKVAMALDRLGTALWHASGAATAYADEMAALNAPF